MKKKIFERILFGVIALLLIVVCTTGYAVFTRLDQVANTPLPTEEEKNSQVLIQEINLNLLKSENLIYTYIYQNHNEAMLDFEILQSKTLRQIGYLKNYQKKNNDYQQTISEIRDLSSKKFDNQFKLMLMRNETRVNETMQLVEKEVIKNDQRTQLELEIRKAAANQNNSVDADKPSRKSRKDRKKENEDIQLKSKSEQIATERIATQNTKDLKKKIGLVKTQAVEKESNINKSKLIIEQSNVQLSKEIDSLFQQIASLDRTQLVNKTQKAKTIAAKTNTITLTFSAISAVLIGFIVILIVYLFRRAKESNYSLKLAKEKSDALTEAKSRFLATMSHEIRTPLNAISGFSEQLTHEKLSLETSKKASIINDSAKHLLLIVNDILDLSKLEENNIKLEESPFNPFKAVNLVVQQFSLATEEQKNTILVDCEPKMFPTLIGDELRFKQILINLIGNANKFTKESCIEVGLKYELNGENAGICTILVKDKGIGMTKQQLAHIFEPFEQAETSTSRKYGGTGLGLSITQKIVQKMGGQITVQSELGVGTCFEITIPMKKSTDKSESKTTSSVDFSILSEKSILIVDDEPFNRMLLKGMFKKENATILEASNGIEALTILNNNTVDLILLDVQMPEMNGEEFIEELKQLGKLKAQPIIGLTAAGDEQVYQEMISRGWTDVLLKPIQPRVLKEKIEKIGI